MKNEQRLDWLYPSEVAEALGISTRTLSRWARECKSPPGMKIGRRTVYRAWTLRGDPTGGRGIDQSLDWFHPQEVAEFLDVSTRTLSRWAREGKGPPRLKIGRRVIYKSSSLHGWLTGSEEVLTEMVRRGSR
jgi:predicted site-specific integrase-resolvase